MTIDDPRHPPQTQHDEQTHPVEGVLVEDEGDVQHEGQHHHEPVKYLKLMLEELQAIRVQFSSQLHHEEREQSEAQVVEHLSGEEVTGRSGLDRQLRPGGSVTHLRGDVAVFQTDDGQIYEQLSQDKDGVHEDQTHNQHLAVDRERA